jgi:Mlc titration factor MtfA (ptsG expression regulator)
LAIFEIKSPCRSEINYYFIKIAKTGKIVKWKEELVEESSSLIQYCGHKGKKKRCIDCYDNKYRSCEYFKVYAEVV